jgi:hypothetical protein
MSVTTCVLSCEKENKKEESFSQKTFIDFNQQLFAEDNASDEAVYALVEEAEGLAKIFPAATVKFFKDNRVFIEVHANAGIFDPESPEKI